MSCIKMSCMKFLRSTSIVAGLCFLLLTSAPNSSFAFEGESSADYFKSLHNVSMNERDDKTGSSPLSKLLFLRNGSAYLIGEENAEALSNMMDRYVGQNLSLNVTPPRLPAFRTRSGFNSSVPAETLMLQANYDFPKTSYGVPFLSAGFGVVSQNYDDFDETAYFENGRKSNNDFIVEAGGGLQIPLDDEVAFTSTYRYLDTNDTEFEGADLDFRAHEFRIGLSFKLQPELNK